MTETTVLSIMQPLKRRVMQKQVVL
jgi:hypothetical protein